MMVELSFSDFFLCVNLIKHMLFIVIGKLDASVIIYRIILPIRELHIV